MKRIAWGFLLFAIALTAQPPSCAIRGIVIDALTNQPLPRTRVFAEMDLDSDDDSPPPVRQITDTNGAFCFQNLTDGSYVIRASRAYYVDTSYGEHWPGDPGQILEVSAIKPGPALAIKMNPQAVISGMLVDTDGDPLQGARIELLKRRWKERKLITALVQQTTTNDGGRYRFAGLAASIYFLRATPTLGGNESPFVRQQILDQTRQPLRQIEGKTYYRDSISFREATPIQVSTGQEIDNLTLTFRATEARHVSGQVAPELLDTSTQILYFSEEDSGDHRTERSVPIQSDGHFLADGLSPDRYLIQGPGVVRKAIDLTRGDIDNLVLEPNQPIELQITVYLQGPHARPVNSLALFNKTPDSDEEARSIPAQSLSENRFKVAVRPGQYEIGPGGRGFPYFIRGLTVDGEPQPRNLLDLQGGVQKSIELFLSSELASVEGRVIGDQPIEDKVTLLLENESDPESFSTKVSGPDGKFQWTLPQAGKYRLYAFEKFPRKLWGNPELTTLLAAKSIVLEVKEGQHRRASIPLISVEDFQAALKKTNF